MQSPTQVQEPAPIRIVVPDGPRGLEMLTQLRALTEARREIRTQVADLAPDNPVRPVLEAQLERLTLQLEHLEDEAAANTQESVFYQSEPSRFEFPRMPDEYLVLGIVFMLSTFLPISIAMAMRIFRRGSQQRTAMSPEIADRINRIEGVVEATALEVERIGEGQRFVTQVMGEHMTVLRDATRAAALVEQDRTRAVSRQVTPH